MVHLNLEPRAVDLVATVFRMGQLERGAAASALRVPERTARNSVSKLTQMGFLKSETPKGALRISFPIDYREKLFPNLFADAPIEAPAPPAHKFGPTAESPPESLVRRRRGSASEDVIFPVSTISRARRQNPDSTLPASWRGTGGRAVPGAASIGSKTERS